MVLKHWILPTDHLKTLFFSSIFGWGDLSQLGSWSEGYVKALKLCRVEEKSQNDQVVTTSKPSKQTTAYIIAMNPLQRQTLD